ncbi:Csa1 family protein [Staphylococcus aureus]
MPTNKAPKLLIKGDGDLKGSSVRVKKSRIYLCRK